MHTTTADTAKTRILLDLKPALDGYAGIPQEARLLFRGLRLMDGCEVEGLIQHGARRLRGALPEGEELPLPNQINRLSRVIVSLYKDRQRNPVERIAGEVAEGIEGYFAKHLLRLRMLAGLPLKPGVFESELFDDFLWRTLFNKTLKPADKDLVAAARYRVLRQSRKLMHQAGLAGRALSAAPPYPRMDTAGFDFFVAQTPFPGRVSPGTRLVVRYHDAVPVLMPHTISDKAFHQSSHFYALQENVLAGARFSCISEATRSDLLKIFPQAEPRASVIHNIVSAEYFDEDSPKGLVFQIIRNRLSKAESSVDSLAGMIAGGGGKGKLPTPSLQDLSQYGRDFNYLLMVSTIEPRKNHLLLLEAWERLKYTDQPGLKLVIVGSLGWDFRPVLNAFRPWAERGELFYLSGVPSLELRALYKHAAATVCPSLAEGFDYTGIEAMRCGCPVASSDIPVHREIYGDASLYFSPYSTEDAAAAIRNLIAPENAGLRARLRERAMAVSDRYTAGAILPRWGEFFRALRRA